FLAVLIIGYHFYAASQAENQITQLIEQQTAQRGDISVQYSDIEVTPFTGKFIISDLTIIFGNHIERTKEITVDLAYLDVLNFYLGGTEYALKHLYEAEALLLKPSYINKANFHQLSSDSLHLHFSGQVLDAIRSAVSDTAFSHNQQIQARGSHLNLQVPQTLITGFKANHFTYSGSVDAGKKLFWQEGNQKITMDSLTWTPMPSFQENYRFIIQGFEYQPDAIPFQTAEFRASPAAGSDLMEIHAELKSELALVSADSKIELSQPTGTSRLQDARITVTDFSPSFKRVLENVEQLLSISLPRNEQGIVIPLKGTLANPQIGK